MNPLAIVFPGQGSQSSGMLQDLAEKFPIIEATFTEASEQLGYDLWAICQSGSAEKLNQTIYTQPAMLAAGVAVYRVYVQQGGASAAIMAGHSLGEYTALVCAQSIAFQDAVKLVQQRARLMQESVADNPGLMAAIIGLDVDEIVKICTLAAENEIVEAANYNAIGQTVIAGHVAAVERAIRLAETAGAKLATLIPVSVPCHCRLLRSAADHFAEYLEQTTIKTPTVPVLSNVDAAPHGTPTQIRQQLKAQLYSPVQWVETIKYIHKNGIGTILEIGPGKVLNGLIKRIDRSISVQAINNVASLEKFFSEVEL